MKNQVLIFEWMMGGGRYLDESNPDPGCPFERQGRSMLKAFVEDLVEAGLLPVVPIDSRLLQKLDLPGQIVSVDQADQLQSTLAELASQVEFVQLVAPESDGCLLKVAGWLNDTRDSWLNPGLDFIKLASDKTMTCDFLNGHQIPTTHGWRLDQWLENGRPNSERNLVLKPNFGAGSEDVRLVSPNKVLEFPAQPHQYRIERFVPGTPVSVSVISSLDESFEPIILTPTQQKFHETGNATVGHYLNAVYPLAKGLEARARALAAKLVSKAPRTNGYFGIDMILGADHVKDVIVEINPRLTSSYLKLREIENRNLAKLIIEMHAAAD